jgi:DNA-directed RNA polymerase sigma subunit (sigma70/sigma32)
MPLYEPSHTMKFSTYAYWKVQDAVWDHLSDLRTCVRIPPSTHRHVRQLRALRERVEATGVVNGEVEDSVAAHVLQLTVQQVATARRLMHQMECRVGVDRQVRLSNAPS